MSDESTEYDALLTRLSSLVRRELGAEDVQLLRQGETAPDAVNVVTTSLTDGRLVVATFANAENREAHQKRLDVLVRAFVESIAESTKHHSRPPPAISLREELRDLALRVNAVDALVLDARSPIVWGAGKTHIGTTAPDDPSSPNLVAVRASEPSMAAPMESTLDLTAAAEAGRGVVARSVTSSDATTTASWCTRLQASICSRSCSTSRSTRCAPSVRSTKRSPGSSASSWCCRRKTPRPAP